jgi:hypothetical protein
LYKWINPPKSAATLPDDRFGPPRNRETLSVRRFDTPRDRAAAATGLAHIAVKDARAAIDAFVAQLNVITKRFNTLAAHHHHKKGGKGGDGETE